MADPEPSWYNVAALKDSSIQEQFMLEFYKIQNFQNVATSKPTTITMTRTTQ